MTITIGHGITVGGGITLAPYSMPITANLVVSYDAGNSMSYSGSGIGFDTAYTGPNLNTYSQYGVFDLSFLTGSPGNSGFLTTSGNVIGWTSRGTGSYFTFDNTSAPNNQYINSSYQQDGPSLDSPTYTLLAVIRPQDFNNGAIVSGFYGSGISYFSFFTEVGGTGILAANNEFNEPVIIDNATLYETNTWYCVAITYDAVSGEMKLYNGGNVVATATGVIQPAGPSELLWGIGGDGNWWLTGDLAVCQAWERVLSADEIASLSAEYLARYVPPTATSSAVLTQTGDIYQWTVPEGVTSISVVAVGGGGGGTQSEYSVPGADTWMYKNFEIFPTLVTGTGNQIIVDTASNPTVTNVTANGSWCVIGNPIGPNGAVDLVTAVTTDGPNTVITIDQVITTTSGDNVQFIEAVVAAEGGYEIPTFFYNQANESGSPVGPGARALALVTDGPYGSGGVANWYADYPIGGGAAGGYGIAGLALNPGRSGSWIYNSPGEIGYNTLAFSNNNLTVSALSGMGDGQANQECMTVGTQLINPTGSKVMFSLTVNQMSTSSGYLGVGLANYSENLQQYLGYSDYSVGWYSDGKVFIGGVNVVTYAPFVAGNVVDIAVDSDLQLAWFRADGGSWNEGVPSADPTTGVGGFDISSLFSTDSRVSVGIAPWYNTADDTYDQVSIATASFFVVPTDYTFIPGVANAGGQGGDGADFWGATNFAGTGGAGGGAGGRLADSGAGGGGTSLYGRSTNGVAGSFVTTSNGVTTQPGGGSSIYATGGQATPWNGGRGGYPGGAGGSATGYWVAGNGGALAYRNDYPVTPGDTYTFQVGAGGQGQENGGSGADGAIRIVWPGDSRSFPATNVGADTVSVPTLDITDSTFAGQSGTVTYNITSNGGSTILESGIVWGLLSDHQYSESIEICAGGSFTEQRAALRDGDGSCGNAITTGQSGSFTQSAQVYNFGGEVINVYAYARNAAGIAYSPTALSWDVVPCLAEGTLITLADGSTKAIEDITMSDTLKVWDFDNGQFATAPVLWLKKKQSTLQYNFCKFSDGSTLRTVGQHRIFNKEAGKFTYPMTDETPVGTTTVKADGTEVTLTDKSVVYAEVNYYNIISSGHVNCYADGILTSNRFNNAYPIADMQYVKAGRATRDRAEFAGIADRWIDGLRLTEQTLDIKMIRKSIKGYENNEKTDPVTQTTISTKPAPAWHSR